MDRYTYKGKDSETNEWVYGQHCTDGIRHWIVDGSKSFIATNGALVSETYYSIDPDTLCQCAGLKDKNKKFVFESAICTDMVGDIFLIFWSNYDCAFMAEYQHTKSPSKKLGTWRLSPECLVGCEVIGNRFDNPELLEGAE